MTTGDLFNFYGAVVGAVLTILGSIWVIKYQERSRSRRDKSHLLSFLAIIEARLNFTRSEAETEAFINARDVPGFINRCALILEMTDLLNSDAVAQAAEGYAQLYALHRLRRTLKIWSPSFEPYSDIPYTDFYTLAEPVEFRTAVESVFVPLVIIRGSVHVYVAQLTGKNIFLDEIKAAFPDMSPHWDPNNPY